MSDRFLYVVLENEVNQNGEYIPCVVFEGKKGYCPTVYRWGKDFEAAKQAAKRLNESMGIEEKEALRIISSSM